jgi:hypothetical protein
LVQKKAAGVLSRLDNNNPLVVEPETENDAARTDCPGRKRLPRDLKFKNLMRCSRGCRDNERIA